MAFSRYSNDNRLFSEQRGTANKVKTIRYAIKSGVINIVDQFILTGDDRLDTMSGKIYGDSSYWWVLAAASNIGWGMQVPPGTVINIVNLRDIESL